MFHKIKPSMALALSGLLLSGPVIAAKDIVDYQTWGTATAVGSLEPFNPALKILNTGQNFKGVLAMTHHAFLRLSFAPG